jgi:hypothetical protein
MTYAVHAVALPSPSLVERALAPCHYSDAFAVRTPAATFGGVDNLARASAQLPRWVEQLMSMRNRVVRVFGLKTEPEQLAVVASDVIVPGGSVGIFPVLARSVDEILMGLDDKHLDFRFSLRLSTGADGECATATTTVRFKNAWGRLYFFFVKPFHKLIIPAMLRGAIAQRLLDLEGPTHPTPAACGK